MAKILLVEDDTNLSEIYQARMEAEGYTVVAASDGEAALAVAAKEKPDLIISDVMMPKISGFEMLDILRNTEGLKTTPVIMLTALGQAEDKTRADSLGANKYLVKSQVTLEDIVKTAQELLTATGGQPVPASTTVASPAPEPTHMPVASPPIPAVPAPTGPLPVTQQALVAPEPTTVHMPVATPPTPQVATPATQAQAQPAPQSNPVSPVPVIPDATAVINTPLPPADPQPAIPTPVTPAIQTPTVTPDSATTAQEDATVQKQINNFVETVPTTTPQAVPTPAAVETADEIDQQVVSNAVEQLVSSADAEAAKEAKPAEATVVSPADPQPVTPQASVAAPAPQPNVPTNDQVEVAHKKIIAPIVSTETKPSLDELLAKEEAKAPTQPSAIGNAASGLPEQSTTQVEERASGQPPVHQPGNIVAPENGVQPQPASTNGFDPNSITL